MNTEGTVIVPVDQEAVTVGELGRNLARFEKTVTDSLGTIGTKLDERPDWKDVRNIEGNLLERIKRLEDWQTWALRIVVGAVLVGILGLWVAAKP